jgi:2-dehydro-3-deoxygalactonokinase
MRSTQNSDRYALGDWGTSRLRLFLIEADEVAARLEGPGIASLAASPAQVLIDLVAPWRTADRQLQVYLAGMVGSRNGWHEVPYLDLPADCTAWSRASWTTTLDGITVTIAGGLCSRPHGKAGDVMRGAEAQIFGAQRLERSLARGLRVLVLPGTHSKWVEVTDGAVTRFRTALTGEMFALLRDNSVLLRASATNDAADDAENGFDAGSRRAGQLDEGLLAALFETRTAQLLRGRSRAWATGFLSGLLIAYEIDTLGNAYCSRGAEVTIVGEPQLAELYRRVLAGRGHAARVLPGDMCVIEGLRQHAECSRRAS